MKININHVAKLASIPLTPEEEDMLAEQLDATLAYIEELNQVDTSRVSVTNTVTNTQNRFRTDDAIDESSMLSQKEATQNAKHMHNGMFVVPAILEEN